MSKTRIEGVGARVGMDRETTIRAFLSLGGEVWSGELIVGEGPPIVLSGPRTEAPPWEGVLFDRVWFGK